MAVAYLPREDVFDVSLEDAARPAGERLQAALGSTVTLSYVSYGGMGRAAHGR